ncbi:MAG: T9SS type A sorting domain-containing protein [candidate division Zixibacteria bacterium]|nr:T9SS type A sorting domain-containing protein [candidate division Zixibacteria bacterium]
MRIISFLIISLTAILMCPPCLGQWEPDGKVIGHWSPYSSAFALANVGNGNIVVVWNKDIGGDKDICAQYIDSAGYTRWGDEGMMVFEDNGFKQWHPAVLHDGEGGVFIVWSDYRHDSGWYDIYGQHLDSLGNLLWPTEGLRLTYGYSNITPQLYDDGHGGFIIIFESSQGAERDIGAQRVNTNGEILWDSTGILLVQAECAQSHALTCRASDSTFITCWIDGRNWEDYDYDIYMQKFDIEGNLHWGIEGLPSIHYHGPQGFLNDGHDIVADGEGGAVIVWVDSRSPYYYGTLFADRFSSDGQSMWEINGVPLGDPLVNEGLECQVFRLGYNFMFRWGGVGDFRVSYISRWGNPLWFDVVALDSVTVVGKAIMEPEGIFIFNSYEAVSSKVDTSGYQYWPNNPYSGFHSSKLENISDGYGGLISVWADSWYGTIHISRTYTDGHVGGDTTTIIYIDEDNIPKDISLLYNYPNPFNYSTTISYNLSLNTDLSFEVFNLLGQRIYEIRLLNQNLGTYNFTLNLKNSSSGVYFIRMSTLAGFSDRLKITLIK